MKLIWSICLCTLLCTTSSQAMEKIGDLFHWFNKWYNPEFQRKHIASQESKDICAQLERIAIEGTAERALDEKTADLLHRFNQRCYIFGEYAITLLKEKKVEDIQKLYQDAPSQEVNIIFKLFMLRALVQKSWELTEEKDKINATILGTSHKQQNSLQDNEALKQLLLRRLLDDREKESLQLLSQFVDNAKQTMVPLATSTPISITPPLSRNTSPGRQRHQAMTALFPQEEKFLDHPTGNNHAQ